MKPYCLIIFVAAFLFSLISCGGDPEELSDSLTATGEAHIVINSNDIFGEVRDAMGNIPSDPNEVIYAKNVFDQPLGLLTPIKAPDGSHQTLAEWKNASGNVTIDCQGNSSDVHISLKGLISNGTYTFWLNFINKKKLPGQSVDFGNDVKKITALGSGSLNVQHADSNGAISTSISHSSCILSEAVTIVLVVVYHINGNTFGDDHIPDAEDVSHLLVYF